jgi:prepilin-type processing-associated H-X9-DG protein
VPERPGDRVPVKSVSSMHPDGANFAFCDGSVKFIKETIASWVPYDNSTGDPVRKWSRGKVSQG